MKKCNCGSCHVEQGAIAVEETCACGHEEASSGHSHEPDPLEHADSCGCGHGHAEGEITSLKQDVISVVAAVLITVPTLLFSQGIARMLLMLAAILIAGAPIFWQGLKNIVRLDFEEMTLMTIAVAAACVIGEYPEALLVTLLFRVGEILEDLAVTRSRREVEAITQIIPDNANLLLPEGGSKTVAARELALGSRILLKSGERVPVDCRVLSGSSSVDASSLTGESVAREVGPGDSLLSGMVNTGGVLTCETVNTFDNSTASKIVEMVRESAAKKGRTERLISRFARVYTPAVIAVAVLVTVVPPLLGLGSVSEWLSRALVFLVAACPCALVIATPLSFFAGIGAASKNGILIKGSKYMEALSKAKGVVFDKTGTLTTGRLSVSGVYPAPGFTREEVLRLAGISESYSNHPIAKAVVEAAGSPDASLAENCEEITSYGMSAFIGGAQVLCGSAKLMERSGVDLSGLPQANVYVAVDGRAAGAVTVFDNPRPDAESTVSALKQLGISHIAMLTGDSEDSARRTGELIGLTQVHAQLLPQDKVAHFTGIQQTASGPVLFVGDGINDSPVLARADAGIAMGMGSDAAIEAADVVLLSDRLASLPQAIRISRKTGRLARVNITFALLVKLAVFVLALLGVASMWMAVFADVGVTILSVLNATRALRFR